MFDRGPSFHARLLCSAAVVTMVAAAGSATAQERSRINIEPQPLVSALNAFGVATGQPVISTPELTGSKTSPGVRDAADPAMALTQLLAGTGLSYRCSGDTYLIVPGPQAGPAPARCIVQAGAGGNDGATGSTVEALIVTAQKREEDIQDVPIAISAFTQEDLTRSQVAGGPDLMTQVPNMTFTKTNFSSYSIQLRGIGTQAISATTDAAVAVAFNNTPFIRNHFFEQEFYDLQRVEVLRGPQGTLYGRNATAGVVNVISAKPKFIYEAKVAADVASYSTTRIEGMVNIPLVEDAVALRLAGAWTKREGYAFNQITGNPIDGRDLWSTRVSLRFAPNDRIEANLIWEHFEEDDDRIRSGKQLCKTDEVSEIAGIPVGEFLAEDNGQGGQTSSGLKFGNSTFAGIDARFSLGCEPASLYDPASFQVVNGKALPYYVPLGVIFLPTALDDPYVSRNQSRDLRVIESSVDPRYRARNDLAELQINIDLTDNLTLTSETAYSADELFSTQDYNRFNTAPGAWQQSSASSQAREVLQRGPNGGIFCDPQIGCSDRLVAMDLSQAESRQFSQELRLSSDFDGPFNFSLGANFLRYDNEDKYYVFINSLSLIAAIAPFSNAANEPYVGGVTDNTQCMWRGLVLPDPTRVQGVTGCVYIDTNPIDSLNDLGHNYFLSKNPYKLISYAAFGEAYYNITENLKVTAGLRWTVDKKQAPRIPSWILAGRSFGYPVTETVDQEWREPTGRLAIDWKPDLAFTDETLLYGSYARGYKAGGANPPPAGAVIYGGGSNSSEALGLTSDLGNAALDQSATHPRTFDPEFVNAFEAGAKNTFLDGRVTLNMAGFYYDYKGYQISQIVSRSAVNLNFDTEVWGLEIEADWRPLENLRLGFKGGYESTRVADGEQAIDVMDRANGGKPDKNGDSWVVVKPFPVFPNNCILPEYLFVATVNDIGQTVAPYIRSPSSQSGGGLGPCERAYLLGQDPVTQAEYVPNFVGQGARPGYKGFNPFDESLGHNFGEGFYKDLGGNELPNAPNFTATLTADYTLPLPNDWLMTLHTDLYYQSEAWTRIFNTEGYDKLKAYTNVNLAAIFANEEHGWNVMAYVKNVFDRDSITGAFLNSDDSGLTTNVFLTEPRLYGLRVTKRWDGGPLLGSFGERREGPYPFTIEYSGQVQRVDAGYETVTPSFVGVMPDALNTFDQAEHRDLDVGDSREIKLSYSPGGKWDVSLGVRYGRANGGQGSARAQTETEEVCAFADYYEFLCQVQTQAGYDVYFSQFNFSTVDARSREEHEIVDFAVGYDLGIGGLNESSVVIGLRRAQLNSETLVSVDTVPDWEVNPGFSIPGTYSLHTRYMADVRASREFEGVGPTVSWDGSKRLFGDDLVGHVDAAWSIGGGALFGKQTADFSDLGTASYYQDTGSKLVTRQWSTPVVVPHEAAIPARSENVTVPVVDLSLGLSYEIDRIKIGAGYRWERYFDAIDGGMDTRQEFDRTMDGPYFKLSVGFGG